MSSQPAQRAFVTGGNRGIGFAIAQGLLAKSYDVLISARSLEQAKQAANRLQSNQPSGQVIPVQLDVSDDASIAQVVHTVSQHADTLDVLINNAGILPDEGTHILTISRALMETTMNTNAFGALRMVQALLPFLQAAPAARVVNVSSGYGELDGLSADVPAYCLSKLAMNGITIMLSEALRSKNIAVNSICPGWVNTDMGGPSAPRTPEQGADTAVWLAAEAQSHETGKFWRNRRVISF